MHNFGDQKNSDPTFLLVINLTHDTAARRRRAHMLLGFDKLTERRDQ